MWRDFLGPGARIIGIDLNPAATKWINHGFEIFIGDQGQDSFWESFYSQVGKVDVLIDDGGHTNKQQITTLMRSLPMVNDGGLIIVEDTHASYLNEFGNPNKSSFQEFCKLGVDAIQSRYPQVKARDSAFRRAVWSITFFESITVFHINRELSVENLSVDNFKTVLQERHENDFRYQSDTGWLKVIKIAQKVFSLEYESIGGRRLYLRPLNFLFTNSWTKKVLRITLYPLKTVCDIMVGLDLHFNAYKLLKRSRLYFSRI